MSHPNNPSSSERLYALDNLRAVMMWLGIVLHVAVIYMAGESPLLWRDDQTSQWADVLAFLIHSFRMPVFFVLGGFFVALLAQSRGLRGMLKNRFMRLGLPFILLWPLIYSVTILLALLFVHRMVRGSWGIDETLLVPREGSPKFTTMHMWFLLMLMWFSVFTVALSPLARLVPARARSVLSKGFVTLACSPWVFVALALPLAGLGTLYKDGLLTASGAFLPPLAEWLHNGLFFVFGLVLHAHRSQLLPLYQHRWLGYTLAGAGFFAVAIVLVGLQKSQHATIANVSFWLALSYNCCAWLWSFALIGLFLRFFGRQSRAMDYLSQSSYWVYLIHFPATVGFGASLNGLPLPALIKMPINIAATTVFALVSYHLLVRSTALGQLLNGRRHHFTFFGLRSSALPQSV